jgi:hypothetical protein
VSKAVKEAGAQGVAVPWKSSYADSPSLSSFRLTSEDKANFHIPKNFDQLKALNVILQRYKDENFGRVMLCWIIVYML